jgi:hypothetical protein
MSKTRIFVSSTCFDLSQVREDIRNCIVNLGHEALLSEYPSFPVYPDLSTIENCKKNVRENTDLFFLIVGGRRGSLDTVSGRSITNLEYETAKQHGIDSFVFVSESVLTMLPVWEKNPTADFTPTVDYPEVFLFIKNLQTDNRWTFPFERASEITEIIRNQLSIFLRELINRKKEGRLKPLSEFANETPRAQQIALDRPNFWEFLLTEELLKSKLARIKRDFDDLERGLIFHRSLPMKGRELIPWISAKCNDLMSLVRLLKISVEDELPRGWGPPGSPGDAEEILRGVNKIDTACKELLNWEIDTRYVIPSDPFVKLKEKMKGWTFQLIREMETLIEELGKPFREPNPRGDYTIKLVFRSPEGAEEYIAEIERLRAHPEEWMDEY